MRSTIVAVLICVGSLGCTETVAGGTGTVRPTVAFEERCVRLAEAEVDREVRCWRVPSEHRASYLTYWSATTYVPYLCGPNPEVDALLANGDVRYDGRDVAAAIAEVAALPCHADPVELVALRDRVRGLRGTRSNGAPCTESLECRDGYCPARACDRTCTALPGVDQPCSNDPLRRCAAGLACVDGSCAPLRNVGEPCDDVPCAAGLICYRPYGETGRCIATVGPDAACDALHHCADDLWCTGGRCDAATLLPDGEPCGFGDGTRCAPHTECRNGTCQAYLHVADPCEPGQAGCYPWGDICDEVDRSCRTQPWVGDACVAGSLARDCTGSLAVCEDGVCVMPPVAVPAVGDPCTEHESCGDDLICDFGACVAGCR